jgi:hypothetical protein
MFHDVLPGRYGRASRNRPRAPTKRQIKFLIASPADGFAAALATQRLRHVPLAALRNTTPIFGVLERGLAAGSGPSRPFHNSAHVRCWPNAEARADDRGDSFQG